jgi:selenide,water dikinase
LSDALKTLIPLQDLNLLVGFQTCDDAAVYRLSEDIALISTVDFITPPVDDPYWFGQVAAANALSDVYAMGGRPLTALNLVMYPLKKLGSDTLQAILRGGNDKVTEAGAVIAGGHSVDDDEPKYGLAVTGVVHPHHILTNCGAQSGDALILTKPLGTGVLFNACRSKKLPLRDLELILPQVASLSKKAMEIALNFTIHACTDVTGFGIVGHALEIAKGSGLQINLFYDQLPFYPNAHQMYQNGEATGSNKANRKLAKGSFVKIRSLSKAEEELLFDPQTSGGLLLAVPLTEADQLIATLRRDGIEAARQVGEVTANTRPAVWIL